jgi:hypothetical protein
MKINLNPKKGGIKIKGDSEELLGLAETLREAADDGESIGHLLTPDGYEQVRVVCEEDR